MIFRARLRPKADRRAGKLSARRAPWLAAALAGLLVSCSRRGAIDAVVLITMESVSADDVSVAHNALATTDTTPPEGGTNYAPPLPEDLDDVATLGVRYSNAFAPSGSAFASLVSIHTGRAPQEAGVYCDLDRLDDMPTLAEALSLCGVKCGAVVARESLGMGCGLARGFESYVVRPRGSAVAGEARVWVDTARLARRDQPIFLWVHLSSARPPYEPRPEYADLLARGVDLSLGDLASLESMAADPAAVSEVRRHAVSRLHAACILQDAASVRQLLGALRPALEDFKNTMILFAGTNGDPAGEFGLFGSRRALNDATLHVPLFAWRRDLQTLPRVASPVVELLDVTPTVASALGAPPPEGARGADLLALVRGQESPDRVAFASWEDRIFTVRTSRVRLVCNPNNMETLGWPPGPARAVREELYDLRLDPRERENLAGAPSQRLEEMRMRLERARATVIPKPPRLERDAERLRALEAEGIHKNDGHPTGALPSSSCGGGRQ